MWAYVVSLNYAWLQRMSGTNWWNSSPAPGCCCCSGMAIHGPCTWSRTIQLGHKPRTSPEGIPWPEVPDLKATKWKERREQSSKACRKSGQNGWQNGWLNVASIPSTSTNSSEWMDPSNHQCMAFSRSTWGSDWRSTDNPKVAEQTMFHRPSRFITLETVKRCSPKPSPYFPPLGLKPFETRRHSWKMRNEDCHRWETHKYSTFHINSQSCESCVSI